MRCKNPECEDGAIVVERRIDNGDGTSSLDRYQVQCGQCRGTGQQPELPGQESMFGV